MIKSRFIGAGRLSAAIAVLGLALGVLVQRPAPAAPPSTESAATQGTAPSEAPHHHVVAAVLTDWQPEFTVDSNGDPDGFAVDVLEAVARRAGIEITYHPVATWEEALDLLRRGEVDLIPNIGSTSDREKWIGFTRPVETFSISVFVRQSTRNIETLDNLSGHVVGVMRENAAGILLGNRAGVSLSYFNGVDTMLLALLSGQVDAVACPEPVLRSLARRIGVDHHIRIVEPPLAEIKRSLGVRRDNTMLLARLDDAVKGFVGTPEYREIYTRWYQETVPIWKRPDFFWVIGGIVLIVVGTALGLHYLRILSFNRRLMAAGAAYEKALAALQASESRYRDLIEGSELAVMIAAASGARLFVNRSFARLLGYDSAEELLALPSGNVVIAPHDRERVGQYREAVLTTGEPVSYEFDALRKDGSLVPAQAFVQRIVWNGEYAIERTLIDLRERRRAEAALRESEARFRHIFESGGTGMFIRAIDGAIVDANKAMAEMLGYERRELIGKNVVDLAPPEDFETVHARFNEVSRGERDALNIERRFVRRDGSTFWAVANIAVARDPSGAPSFVVTVVRDINERKLAEEVLAESEMRYRHLVERFPLGISIYGKNGDRLFVNEAFAHLIGYESAEAAMAAPRGSLLLPEDREAIRKLKSDSFAEGIDSSPHEMRLLRRDGSVVPVQAMTRLITWAGQEAVQRTFVDLSQRKQAEAALRASEERFRSVFEAGGAGMALCDSKGRYFRVNKAFCDLLGYSADELIGRTPVDIAHPEEREATRAAQEALTSGASNGRIREKRYRRKDGGTLWAIVCVVVATDPATGERYQIGIVQDITERKLAEQAVAESEMRFRHMFERFPLGIQIFGRDGQRLFTNDAFARLVGWVSAEDVASAPKGSLTPPEERGQLIPWLAGLHARAFDTEPEEIRLLNRDGTVVPVQAFSQRIAWAGMEAVQRIYVDLTERKLAEEALRTSEERFRTVFEASGAGMVLCDMEGRYQRVNRAFCDLLDYREDELVGRSVLDVTHPDDLIETQDTTQRLKDGETRHIREKRYIRKDGSTVWAIVCVVIVRDGETGQPYQIGIVQDITERKRAEEALAESTARLINAQRIARIGDWERDLTSERLIWSDEVYRIVGIDRNAVEPTFRWFREQVIHSEDRAMVAHRVSHALATGEPYGVDHRIVRPDGEVRIVHEEAEVTFAPDGAPVRFAGTIQDVTELRQAKQALEASEARFRGVFEAGGAAIVLSDRGGRIYDFNRAFADLIGYDEAELKSRGLYELMLPDDARSADEQRRAVFTGQIERYHSERRYLRKDGSIVWAGASVTAMPRIGDEPELLIAILQDITQRKNSEAALAEKSELVNLMRGLAEAANQASSFADAVRDCLFRVCAYTGWSVGHAFIRSEIDPDVLRPMLIWYFDDQVRFERYRSATEQMVLRIGTGVPGQVLASGKVEWRTQIPVDPTRPTVRSDAARDVGFRSGSAAPVMAGSRIVAVLEFYSTEILPRDEGIVEVLRQAGTELGRVYEREQAHKDARRREEQLRQIIDNVPHWIYVKDREGRYLLANKALASGAYGLTIDELIGRTQQELLHDDAQAAHVLAHDRSVIVAGQVTVTPNATFRTADGSIRNLRITKMPYATQSGELAVLGIGEDVTEQLAIESERRRAQRMDALGKMTGGVAHDFNNLLTIILGNLQLLERRLKDDPLRSLAQTAERAARRGADVTRRLLAFARSQPLEPRLIELNEMVRDMTALVERSLGSTIEIQTVLANELWQTRADPGQVENALLNLVINSRDAMPHGGRLVIETSNVTIGDRGRRPGDVAPGEYVTVAVKDNGVGMSEDVIARAVEPFFTTKEVGKGSGLGLSMIYGFVRQSGGDMTIESEVGRGTVVRLYLPRALGAIAPGPEREAPVPVGARESVLLVEDDPDVRRFARTALANLEYRVIEAENGSTALDALDAAGQVDLLFVDMTLPGGMDGLMVAEAARRRRPGIGVLVTSGNPETSQDEQAAESRTAFLRKPYTQKDLATMIRSVLDRRERLEA